MTLVRMRRIDRRLELRSDPMNPATTASIKDFDANDGNSVFRKQPIKLVNKTEI
jgi:hypothetical protein